MSYEKGQPVRQITTKATSTTFFSAKSDLAKFKASQTDKTQSATVGSLGQEGGQTNAAISAGAFIGEIIKHSK